MSDIAGHLGITKAALYRHVTGKPELLRAVTRPARDALLALVAESAVSGVSGAERLGRLLRGLAAGAQTDPSGYFLVWHGQGAVAEDDRISACRDTVVGCLVELLEEAVAEGGVRDDLGSPWLVARLLLGAVVPPTASVPQNVGSSDTLATVEALLGGLAARMPARGASHAGSEEPVSTARTVSLSHTCTGSASWRGCHA